MIHQQLLNKAIKKAQQTSCRYSVFAIGFNLHGDVLGVCSNQRNIDKAGMSRHAEIMLIRRFRMRLKSIIIGRTNNKGELLPIDCCNTCKKILNKYNIDIKTIKS